MRTLNDMLVYCWYQGFGLGTAAAYLKKQGQDLSKSDIRNAFAKLSQGLPL